MWLLRPVTSHYCSLHSPRPDLKQLHEKFSQLGWGRSQQAAGDGPGAASAAVSTAFCAGVYSPRGGGGPAPASPGVTSAVGTMAGQNCITEHPPRPWGLHPALLPALLLLTALRAVPAVP